MDLNNKMIIVDDQILFRKGMKYHLENKGLCDVIAEAENCMEFFDSLDHQKPDLVLISFAISGMDGLEVTKKAIAKYPDLRILVYNLVYLPNHFTDIIKAGAMGVLQKGSGIPELEKAIKTVLDGESYFPCELMRGVIFNLGKKPKIHCHSENMEVKFSNRELEILKCFCDGLSANDIAGKLCRSIKTIECHRSNLLQKTATKNTINLVLFAIKNKLVYI